jgi:elongation factor 1-gamma
VTVRWSTYVARLSITVRPIKLIRPISFFSYERAKIDLASALQTLNTHLKDKSYLVNDRITLADIVIVSALVYPLKLVADELYLKPYAHVVRWFTTCVSLPEFQAVVGHVQLCKSEIKANGH